MASWRDLFFNGMGVALGLAISLPFNTLFSRFVKQIWENAGLESEQRDMLRHLNSNLEVLTKILEDKKPDYIFPRVHLQRLKMLPEADKFWELYTCVT